MDSELIDHAIELLDKANADLQPELLPAPVARRLLASYARAEKLAAFGVAALARRIDEAAAVARVTGTSVGKAKETIATSKALNDSAPLEEALKHGEISLDQATEIARAEESAPGVASELVEVARDESFRVLRDKARKAKLDAEQHKHLALRQHRARSARSYGDELGMVHIHLALEPHVGSPIIARAEAEAARLARAASHKEPFEAHLADAYAKSFSGSGTGRTRRPELVVLVSHQVTQRGWTDVREDEICKIPGVGPISPQVAKEIAQDAFLSGVFFDGKDLRNFARWTRNIPIEVAIALELGAPSEFDGVCCVDCGNRFRTEFDHVEPHVAQGWASSGNLKPRCWSCHQAKTKRDRKAGKLKPPEP